MNPNVASSSLQCSSSSVCTIPTRREDTVLFPAFRKIVSPHEFDALGEDFEKKEDELFGEDGFEKVVDKVAGIEKQLGIYDLAQFTPKM
jgi:hypothetical protein